MNRIRVILGTIVAAVALCSCSPEGSLLSLYSKDDDQAFEEQLLGEWKLQDGADAKPDEDFAPMLFEKGADGSSYVVTTSNLDGRGLTVLSTARLVRIGDVSFIDFEPRDLEEIQPPAGVPFPTLQIHFIGRVRFERSQIHLDFLDDNWTSKQVKAGQLLLPTVETENGTIIAAKTEELRKFALAHAEDEEAFCSKFVLTRMEPAAPLQ